MAMAVDIRPISPAETVRMRYRILWPSIPVDEQLLAYDTAAGTTHLGAFLTTDVQSLSDPVRKQLADGQYLPGHETTSHGQWPIGNLTVTHEAFPRPEKLDAAWRELPGRQVHKFAVHEAGQGHGIGSQLLRSAIEHVRRSLPQQDGSSDGQGQDRAGALLHLDCRATAIKFYERFGMRVLDGDVFIKRGPNGKGPEVAYIRMGLVIRPGAA